MYVIYKQYIHTRSPSGRQCPQFLIDRDVGEDRKAGRPLLGESASLHPAFPKWGAGGGNL